MEQTQRWNLEAMHKRDKLFKCYYTTGLKLLIDCHCSCFHVPKSKAKVTAKLTVQDDVHVVLIQMHVSWSEEIKPIPKPMTIQQWEDT